MSAHLSEEEQIESLKRWWKDNGKNTVLMIVAGVVLYFGWVKYQDYQQDQAQAASVVYLKLLDSVAKASAADRTDEQRADAVYLAVTLKDEYPNSQYAYYAGLMMAKLAVEQSDFDSAVQELQVVVDSSADDGLKRVARLRLARVAAARGEYDKALALLSGGDQGDLASAYAEARGDVYQLQGDNASAQTAYQQAINRATGVDERSRQLLELKLNRVSSASADGMLVSSDESAEDEPKEQQQEQQ